MQLRTSALNSLASAADQVAASSHEGTLVGSYYRLKTKIIYLLSSATEYTNNLWFTYAEQQWNRTGSHRMLKKYNNEHFAEIQQEILL